MNSVEIERLEKLLGKKHFKYSTKPLTVAGENYGSIILALQIEEENGKIVHAIAKLLPSSQFLRQILNTEVTFKNEWWFYKFMIPTFQKFHQDFSKDKQTLEFFPEFLGGRLNLEDNDSGIDEQACLLLENLKIAGYTTMKAQESFNVELAKLVLNDLARFHAVGIGLKMKESEMFEKQIKPHFQKYKAYEISSGVSEKFKKYLREIMHQDESLVPFLPKVMKIFENSLELLKNCPKNDPIYEDGPWSTLIHTDLWPKNIMVKFHNDNPVKIKFVDFQTYEFGSATRDLAFFLFQSLHKSARPYFDDLIKFYYERLIEVLRDYSCDVNIFCYKDFMTSFIKWTKNLELIHTLLMINPIFLDNDKNEGTSNVDSQKRSKETLSLGVFIIKKCLENNWI